MRILRILRQRILLSIVANGIFCSVAWAGGDPFPAFSSLKEPVISPGNAVLSIDKDGTILLIPLVIFLPRFIMKRFRPR